MTAERCPNCGRPTIWSGGRLICPNPHCPGAATSRSSRRASLAQRAALQSRTSVRSSPRAVDECRMLPAGGAAATLMAPTEKRPRGAANTRGPDQEAKLHGHTAR